MQICYELASSLAGRICKDAPRGGGAVWHRESEATAGELRASCGRADGAGAATRSRACVSKDGGRFVPSCFEMRAR